MITRIFAMEKDKMIREKPFIIENDSFVAISMINPGDARVFEKNTDRILTVFVSDITPGPFLHHDSVLGDAKFMSTSQARWIVERILDWKKSDKEYWLMINCSAGINRSGAVAKFALAHADMVHSKFYEDNPQIQNNEWVYWKLIEAYREITDGKA